ncbi:fimbrillin family protein [Bacteroides timonensis]|uniref:fimbrillin family protein n=1 Tax=Bacteroides timonensis TaxID=1470345 RepID=UPI000693982D|nr:fimbrillin family protein [Bacteroides timonensis]
MKYKPKNIKKTMKKKDFTRAGTFSGKRIGAVLCAATFLLCGCGNDSETAGTDTDSLVPLQVNAGIETRAYNNLWNKDDAIGIYMLNGTTAEAVNKKYTTDVADGTASGTFKAADGDIYLPVNGDGRDFIAYYPHQAGMAENGNKYAIDLSDQSSQKAIDLMRSAKVTDKNKNNASVAFLFSHKLVKIEVTIEHGNGVAAEDLAGTTVALTNQPVKGSFDVLTEGAEAVPDAITEVNTLNSITLYPVLESSKYEAIVFPAETTEGMEMEFIVPKLSETVPFTFTVSDAGKSKQFVAGNKYLYTIKINKMGIGVTSTIESWGYGNGEDGEKGNAE